jgi:D-beta-D-heptose 7-phosphate kinase/D-beta-D-heptose 1-phosphate adenosyltransferase
MKNLIDLIDSWQTKRVMVVGDYMLDQYVYGNAERLSPDAPVPIVAVEREEHAAGGASNVCVDLRALRCEVICVGITGKDLAADQLRGKLNEAGCDTTGLLATDDGRPTTVKRSYIGLAQHRHPQKMLRVDFERKAPIDEATKQKLIDVIRRTLPSVDVVCLEDYNKGVCTPALCQELIRLARQHGVPVMVDPAAIEDYSKYRGCTTITPNRTEASLATGLPTNDPTRLQVVAEKLLADLELEAAVLTLDRHGALLLERGMVPQTVPTVARQVYDVTGAGDMVLAMLAASRGNGAQWLEAVQLANVAAGLEVEKWGVVPIPLEEVHLWLLMQNHRTLGKVRTIEQLEPEIAAYRKMGKKVAFTNGCFDILHAGHIEVLRGARSQGDLLVLAVNADVSIKSLKGEKRPIIPQAERVKLLGELECVDYVILFGDGSGGENDTPKPLLRALKPDVLVKGGTYKHHEVVGWEIVESYGGKVVTIPPVEGLSTTNIVEKIRSGK